MLLTISAEREALQSELHLLSRIFYKLNNQMRHFKELNQLPLLIKLTRKHLAHLTVF